MIHNKTLIEQRFGRTLARYHTMAVVQRQIAEKLATMIPDNSPRTGVEIGSGSGFLTQQLIQKFPRTHWIANDITARSEEFLPEGVEFRAEDGEQMQLPTRIDILASSSTVQWFDNLPRFIARAHSSISPEGIVALSTFGPENFREITESIDYNTLGELEEMFNTSGFTIIESMEWIEQMHFDTPLEVLRHIKATGVNAITTTPWGPRKLQAFIDNYPSPATLTFHPMIIIARK